MSDKQDEKNADTLGAAEKPGEARVHPLADISGLLSRVVPAGVDRRIS